MTDSLSQELRPFYLARGMDAQYRDQRDRLSVLSHISKITCLNVILYTYYLRSWLGHLLATAQYIT